MIGHEGQRECAWKCDGRGEGLCKEVNHRDGKGSKDQRDDPEVSFWFCEGVELVGEDEKEGGMEISWVLFVKL
jgi:hypothetical protein